MVGMVTRDIKLWEEFLGLCGRCYNNTDFKCHRSEALECLIGVYVCVVEGFFFVFCPCMCVCCVGGCLWGMDVCMFGYVNIVNIVNIGLSIFVHVIEYACVCACVCALPRVRVFNMLTNNLSAVCEKTKKEGCETR